MKNPIETKDDKTTIDNEAVNTIAQKLLNAIKAFTISLLGQTTWDRLGLEKTWKFFLPLAAVLTLMIIHYLSYYAAFGVLVITAFWLLKKQ